MLRERTTWVENLTEKLPKNFEIKVLLDSDPEFEKYREKLLDLESEAYGRYGYGHRCEGEKMFTYPIDKDFQGRELTCEDGSCSPITHVILTYNHEGKEDLFAYVSYFEMFQSQLFRESAQKLLLDPEAPSHNIVMRKILKADVTSDGVKFERILKDAGCVGDNGRLDRNKMPHRLALVSILNYFKDTYGSFTMETIGQPATRRMMEGAMNEVFKDSYTYLVNEPIFDILISEIQKDPRLSIDSLPENIRKFVTPQLLHTLTYNPSMFRILLKGLSNFIPSEILGTIPYRFFVLFYNND